ncbi:cytidylyltransferase domain-containing protein [Salinivibrio kushneri]|uniref:acylneuraminate cytidylyltransferase family protein n=1 Tax=Salinivibrio kushneri TaxID=1908198 RepID=UPI0022B5A4A3|nr:acylneuraminate cytidylyltransferase family protein [Salinivibrio kushneri]WBA17125.1 acylneuraminate cytidylyltransferase family protein [Salinivibrio kushneri]
MITAFLPCRKGSQRIPDKNIKPFAGIEGGLLKIKLDQLLQCKRINRIVLSSNDERILEYAESLNESNIVIDRRPDYLGSSSTTTDSLINYVPSLIHEGHILWTHVTSPFMLDKDYDALIDAYLNGLDNGYDSLMTVLKLQGFIWNKQGPMSYQRDKLKWPMTQNIEPLYEVDSGAFISSVENYIKYQDRIGSKPVLFEQEKIKAVDIDWPEDFTFAEYLWKIKL